MISMRGGGVHQLMHSATFLSTSHRPGIPVIREWCQVHRFQQGVTCEGRYELRMRVRFKTDATGGNLCRRMASAPAIELNPSPCDHQSIPSLLSPHSEHLQFYALHVARS